MPTHATDWSMLRRRYADLLHARRLTQTRVATLTGLPQNTISKLLSNTRRGPAVETFVRAVEGLGVPLRVFLDPFAGSASGAPTIPWTTEDVEIATAYHHAPSDVRARVRAILVHGITDDHVEQLRERYERARAVFAATQHKQEDSKR